MKIGFYAYYKSFDFLRIGGTDSFIRRLTFALIKFNSKIKVHYILYGSINRSIDYNNNLKLVYTNDFKKSLNYIETEKFDHIIITWLLKRHRNVFYNFSKKHFLSTKFHYLIFFYPNTFLKKLMKFYELTFNKYNGVNFVVSERQRTLFNYFKINTVIINPPVDNSYFNISKQKNNNKINLTFLGRIDPRKGINEVISVFEKIKDCELFELNIHGIYIDEDLESKRIHNMLKNQNKINYHEGDREKFSNKIDSKVIDILKNTDVFIQPYKNLDSTVDSPLLLIEALACNCIVLSTKIPPVTKICGHNEFIIDCEEFIDKSVSLLLNLSPNKIKTIKSKILPTQSELAIKYQSSNVAQQFLNEIN